MSLYLVTGLPGSGKTTTCKELQSRGYTAYDGDLDNFAEWYNKETGLPIEESERVRTAEFGRNHSRDISRDKIEGLSELAVSDSVFLCADPENMDELRDLFSMVFVLVLNEGARRERLATRTNNNWGKLPHEIERDQIFRQKQEEDIIQYELFTIDAEIETASIADIILSEVQKLED